MEWLDDGTVEGGAKDNTQLIWWRGLSRWPKFNLRYDDSMKCKFKETYGQSLVMYLDKCELDICRRKMTIFKIN